FLGGIIKFAQPLSAFFNPTINSYRRINAPATKSGASWSPSSISYSGNNRTHMIRIPDPGRFELRLMDGSSNPYLLQAGIIAAGLYGIKNKLDPGEALTCNMYNDYKNYPNLEKLPDELEEAIDELNNSKEMREAFGDDVINSYIKLKNQELDNFSLEENFNKDRSITEWEKKNTLDC
ncbi:MAG: type III glutamate--ammonia ligase, partial [Gammaproteobacteria bacterium]|nr:type III glutamate--ammonia ligase [Gammaproteobacteria bacterium]